MAKEDARNRTYFVAPGWDLHANAATLGSVITHPTQPQLSIFTPGPEDLGSSVQTIETASFVGEPALHKQGETRLFGTFIDLYGLGDEATLQYDRHAVLSYSINGMKTRRFTPSAELKRRALAPGGRVAQYLQAGESPSRVFMITGVKTVTGAGVTTASAKGMTWRVSLSVGAQGAAAEGDSSVPVVYALELEELALPVDGAPSTGAVLDGVQNSKDLKQRLDGVFGDDIFTVLEGVDEAESAVSSCRIVASSPTCVDLLTASSARIGRDASRSRLSR